MVRLASALTHYICVPRYEQAAQRSAGLQAGGCGLNTGGSSSPSSCSASSSSSDQGLSEHGSESDFPTSGGASVSDALLDEEKRAKTESMETMLSGVRTVLYACCTVAASRAAAMPVLDFGQECPLHAC